MEIIAAMDEEFHEQPDRVIATVGAAYLDSALDTLLRAVLIDSEDEVEKLLGPSGALGANGARCQLAYCLGLITVDQRDDIKTIAKIRNKFAHEYSIKEFNMEPVRDYCAALKDPIAFATMPKQLFGDTDAARATEYIKSITATPREKFRTTVIGLLGSLIRRIEYVRRENHDWFSSDPDALGSIL
jgi:DNA-binding MltR family transcriptional regulator